MNYKLVMLQNPIIISDADIKINDYCYFNEDIFKVKSIEPNGVVSYDGDYYRGSSKIEAGFPDLGCPKINFNGFEEKLGIINIEKLAHHYFQSEREERELERPDGLKTPQSLVDHFNRAMTPYYVEGFNAAQSINEKKFSLEDMKKLYTWTVDVINAGHRNYNECRDKDHSRYDKQADLTFEDIVNMISQPKIYDIVLETEYSDGYGNWYLYQPKIVSFEKLKESFTEIKTRMKITDRLVKITEIVE